MGRFPNNAIILTSVKGERGPKGFSGDEGNQGSQGPIGSKGLIGDTNYSKVDISFTSNRDGFYFVRTSLSAPEIHIGSFIFPGISVATDITKIQAIVSGEGIIAISLRDELGNLKATGSAAVSSTPSILYINYIEDFDAQPSVINVFITGAAVTPGGAISFSDSTDLGISYLEIK